LTGPPWALAFWLVLAVNATQAAGVFVIPTAVFRATLDLYGPVGLMLSLVTDGGALGLTAVLLGRLARWVRRGGPKSSRTAPTKARERGRVP
jgi:hypothetical protein